MTNSGCRVLAYLRVSLNIINDAATVGSDSLLLLPQARRTPDRRVPRRVFPSVALGADYLALRPENPPVSILLN